MAWRRYAILLLATAAAVAGCGDGEDGEGASAPPGRVAVIDLGGILRATGKETEINQKLEELDKPMRETLEKERDKLQKQIEEKEKEFGDNPTDEQKQELDALRRSAAQTLQTLDAQRRRRLTERRNQLLNEFQDQIRAVARQVARKKGMSVVLTTNVVFTSTSAADITEDVLIRANELISSGQFRSSAPQPPGSGG
jgi:Skp family chaperone for outer membrane proteins